MIVVSDTSPLRALAHLQRIDILASLFGEVLVPPAVEAEVREPIAAARGFDLTQVAFVRIQGPSDAALVQRIAREHELDPGETEALALALEVSAEAVLIDESEGRSVARRLGLAPIGVLGILLRAKQLGLVAEIRPMVLSLRDELRFFLSGALVDKVLRLAGE